jgi:hypothetical protein
MKTTLGSTVSRLAAGVVALWLGAGSAWAGGGGGADAGTLQSFLTDSLCPFLGMSPSTCPTLPNVTQLVLETAALENTAPEMVRAMNSIAPTAAANAVNPPAGSPFALSNVTPLAFISSPGSNGSVSVTQPGDPSANSFFYAATDGISPNLPPTTLYLVLDYPLLTNPTPATGKGLDLADITIPLTVLSGYPDNPIETPLPILLQIRGASGSPGYTAVASGNFSGSPVAASALGLTVTLTFQTSPNSASKHAIIQVQVPLVVTMSTDPAYYSSLYPIPAFLSPIFTVDLIGTKFSGSQIGMAPVASQITASIASTSGGGRLVPAVNAYLAIAGDGETLVSVPLP